MKIIKQLIVFILSFVFVLILAELFIRNAKISEVSFAEYYDDIGKGLAHADTYVYFNEGFGITSTNSSRFIGEDVPFKKEENTIRIALIGDSYVESIQIFERHYFGNITEDILNKKYNQQNIKIEVLNFGRSSFNIGNMYAYQKLFVDKFNPDYILYFLSINDLKCDYSYPPLLPITTIDKSNLITTINNNKEELNTYQNTKFLTQNFALGNILNFCRNKINDKETLPIILDKFYTKTSNTAENIPYNAGAKYEIDSITYKIINTLDANTIIVNRDTCQLPKTFKALCIANDLRYLELSPTFDSLKNSGIMYNKWTVTNKVGHWKQNTHKAIGVTIANEISDIIQHTITNKPQ